MQPGGFTAIGEDAAVLVAVSRHSDSGGTWPGCGGGPPGRRGWKTAGLRCLRTSHLSLVLRLETEVRMSPCPRPALGPECTAIASEGARSREAWEADPTRGGGDDASEIGEGLGESPPPLDDVVIAGRRRDPSVSVTLRLAPAPQITYFSSSVTVNRRSTGCRA